MSASSNTSIEKLVSLPDVPGLKTPGGMPAGSTDRVMLLAMWAKHLDSKTTSATTSSSLLSNIGIIRAGMGKPTAPLSVEAARAGAHYYTQVLEPAIDMNSALGAAWDQSAENPDESLHTRLDAVSKGGGAIDYDHPAGDLLYRTKMAEGLRKWYSPKLKRANSKEVSSTSASGSPPTTEPAIAPQMVIPEITAEHIIFTVGGVAALNAAFKAINKQHPHGRIVTPAPYYSLYPGEDNQNRLHFIHVMQEKGYKLTAKALREAIKEAEEGAKYDQGHISAFLFCDPNNPLGTTVGREQWEQIATVLRGHPGIPIILDGAYEEMVLREPYHVSLLAVAPDLSDRIILIRSATKGFSAAGERMAVAVIFDRRLREEVLSQCIASVGHAPRSSQAIYAEAMLKFNSVTYRQNISYYREQVDLILRKAGEIGITMPDPTYKPDSTFYVMVDLSDLIGLSIPKEAERALGKSGAITSDQDITYALLCDPQTMVMISPGSYFGLSPSSGFMRITCSSGPTELKELINRIEPWVVRGRMLQREKLIRELRDILQVMRNCEVQSNNLLSQIEKVALGLESISLSATVHANSPLELKKQLTELRSLLCGSKLLSNDLIPQKTFHLTPLVALAIRQFKNDKQKWKEEVTRTVVNKKKHSGYLRFFMENKASGELSSYDTYLATKQEFPLNLTYGVGKSVLLTEDTRITACVNNQAMRRIFASSDITSSPSKSPS